MKAALSSLAGATIVIFFFIKKGPFYWALPVNKKDKGSPVGHEL